MSGMKAAALYLMLCSALSLLCSVKAFVIKCNQTMLGVARTDFSTHHTERDKSEYKRRPNANQKSDQPTDHHALYNAQHVGNTATWNHNPRRNDPAQYSTLNTCPSYSNQYRYAYPTENAPYRQSESHPDVDDRERELTGPEDDKILAIGAGLVQMLSSDITDVISGFLNVLQAL